MGNINKTVIHIPLTQGWSIFVFTSYQLLFQNSADLRKIPDIKKDCVLVKRPKYKKFGS